MANDYNDTRYYLKKRGELCERFKNCINCPLALGNNKRQVYCNEYERDYPEEAIATVKEWYEQNANVTYKDDFFSKFPNADKTSEGYPKGICPCMLYPEIDKKVNGKCIGHRDDCSICWDMEKED